MKLLLSVLLLIGCKEGQEDKKPDTKTHQTSFTQAHTIAETQRLQGFAQRAKIWCAAHHYNNQFFFLVDMSLPSGRNRFFVYDLKNNAVIRSSLVAHGSCGYAFLQNATFSNEKGCGCSSSGKYKIGGKYAGRFGTAYKLIGLDSSNSNALERNIVLHSYPSVPDEETYPEPIGNSLGCPMVSEHFLKVLETKIDSSEKPILLWVTK